MSNELKALLGVGGAPELAIPLPFSPSEVVLPDLEEEDDEFDLLSNETVLSICQTICRDMVSPEIAGMSAGIPATSMREYLSVGNADLAAGIDTRSAVLAKYSNQAVFAVIAELTRTVRRGAFGWQSYSFILERMFPDFFSSKRENKKDAQNSTMMEALQRQLTGISLGGKDVRRKRARRDASAE